MSRQTNVVPTPRAQCVHMPRTGYALLPTCEVVIAYVCLRAGCVHVQGVSLLCRGTRSAWCDDFCQLVGVRCRKVTRSDLARFLHGPTALPPLLSMCEEVAATCVHVLGVSLLCRDAYLAWCD